MGIVLALALAAPAVGVQTDGTGACDSKSFVRALATLRPELQIIPLDSSTPAPGGAWVARIEGLGFDQAMLRVAGGPTPLQRSLPGEDCARAVQTAASIVDGYLDQLPNPARDIELRRAVPRRTSLDAWFGAGILQGPIQSVFSFALGARFGLGTLEFVGTVDLGLAASVTAATLDFGQVGNYRAVPFDVEGGVGWGPHLGPGRLSLDGLLGFALANVTTSPTVPTDSHLFGAHWEPAAAFFVAAGAGYAFELPAHFIFGLRAEERLAVQRVTVSVDGTVPGDEVMTRRWTFIGTVFVGYRLF